MAKHNTVRAEFGHQRVWRLDASTAISAAILLLLGLLLANGALTQWVAAQFGYSPALGEALWRAGDTSYYYPWRWAEWAGQLASDSPIRERVAANAGLTVVGPLLLALIVIGRSRTAFLNRAGELHGSARWADRDDLEQAGLLEGKGVFLATWRDTKAAKLRYLRHDGPEHAIALAPTRSGKGVGIVLPTLLTWPHSALILDPKAENWALTSGRRAQLGHRVFCFNPASMTSHRFNPLAEVRTGTEYEIADVQLLAVTLVNPTGAEVSGASEHFNTTAAALLAAAILHCLYRFRNERGGAPTLADLALELGHPERTPEATLEGWMSYRHLPSGTHPLVASEARSQMSRMATPEGSGVWSTARRPLALFLDPVVSAVTSASDFSLEDLVANDVPTSIYLSVPAAEFSRLKPLLRLFINLALRRLTRELDFVDGAAQPRGQHRVLMLLDEFPTLGKIKQLEEALAYMSGFGVKALLIAQTYNQVVEAYGRHESVLANCHVKVAYAPGDMDTAKLLSSMAGETTVEMKSRSYSLGGPGGRKVSESFQEVKRPLMTPDEVATLPGPRKDGGKIVAAGDVLTFAAGRPAARATQMLYFEDPSLLAWSKIPAPAITPLRPVAMTSVQAVASPARAPIEFVDPALAALASLPDEQTSDAWEAATDEVTGSDSEHGGSEASAAEFTAGGDALEDLFDLDFAPNSFEGTDLT